MSRVINVEVVRVSPDKIQQLRSWLAEVQTRTEEARATLANEGVRHERVLLVETSAARTAFLHSKLPLDLEHKQVMSEVRGEPSG